MTDNRLSKVRAEIEKCQKQIQAGAVDNRISKENAEAYRICVKLISIIDSMLEEPTIPDIVDEHWWEMLGEEPVSNKMGGINNALSQDILAMKSIDETMAEVEEKTKAFTEAHKGESSEQLLAEMRGEDSVSEELIDVAKQYVKEHVIGIDKVTFSIATDMFISGAKWQKQKDAEALNENALLYNARLEGIEIGKAEMKQQMMKDAINITPDTEWDNIIKMLRSKLTGNEKLIIIKEGKE